jgi:hydroxypyruvate isomerase
MPRFAASVMLLFAEAPFAERFALARRAGFRAVECQNPYDWPAEDIRRLLGDAELEMVLLNAPAGEGAKGERGFAALPGREREFRESLALGLDYARALSCSRLHVLAGNAPEGADLAAMERTYVANLRFAAARAGDGGVRVLIEPLNAIDAPGYFLNRMAQARAIVDAVGHPNLWLQYDVYHAAMSGASPTDTFREHASRIAHIQVAGMPGRHEPEPSEIPCGELFALFDSHGYDGWIGCEYRPRAGTAEGLAWAAKYGLRPLGDRRVSG